MPARPSRLRSADEAHNAPSTLDLGRGTTTCDRIGSKRVTLARRRQDIKVPRIQ